LPEHLNRRSSREITPTPLSPLLLRGELVRSSVPRLAYCPQASGLGVFFRPKGPCRGLATVGVLLPKRGATEFRKQRVACVASPQANRLHPSPCLPIALRPYRPRMNEEDPRIRQATTGLSAAPAGAVAAAMAWTASGATCAHSWNCTACCGLPIPHRKKALHPATAKSRSCVKVKKIPRAAVRFGGTLEEIRTRRWLESLATYR